MAEKKPKFGAGHFTAMLRKGFTEAGQYLPAFNTAGQQTIEDPGVWPNATQMEINQGKGVRGADPEQGQAKSLSMDELRQSAKERAEAAQKRMENGHRQERENGNDGMSM
jgi:hypothetical protein